jgi:CHAT domain-containing protein
MFNMRIILFFISFLFSTHCYLQSTANNLEQEIASAIAFQKEEEHQKAVTLLEAIIGEEDIKDLSDSLRGYVYHKLGVSLYYLSQNKAAIKAWDEAINLRKKYLPAQHIDLIKGIRNKANAYVQEGAYDLAEENFERALRLNLSRKTPDSLLLTEIYREQGYVLAQQNDLINAERYLKIAEKYSLIVYESAPWEIAKTYNLLVLLCEQKKAFQQMIFYAEKGLAICEGMEEKYEEDYWNMIDFYNNLGIAYEGLGDYQKGIDYYQKSIALNKKYPTEGNNEQAAIYSNLAGLYKELGDFKSAFHYVDLAERLDLIASNRLGLAVNANIRGDIFLKKGEFKEALEHYQQGHRYLVSHFKSENVHDLPAVSQAVIQNKPLLIEQLFDKVLAYQKYAEKTGATTHLIQSLQVIDSINVLIHLVRTGFTADASKQFLTNRAKAIFETGIDICFELSKKVPQKELYYKKAFQYAEQSKAIILLESARETGAKTFGGIPTNLIKKEQQLNKKIADLEAAIFLEKEAARIAQLQEYLILQQQTLAVLIDTFEQFYPIYYQTKYRFESLAFSPIQQKMADQEAIIEYFMGEQQQYWFYLDKKKIEMGLLDKSYDFKKAIKNFRNSIFNPFLNKTAAIDSLNKEYIRLGRELYQQLLAPASTDKRKLRIIPDGILGNLPFDALLNDSLPLNQIGKYKNYPFLLKQYQLCYSYSLSFLEERKEQQQKAKLQELLAFAPIFRAKKPLYLGETKVTLRPILTNVATTEQLLATYKGKAYLKEAAQKDIFLKEATQYAFLHLASHAQINDENAHFSFISFEQSEESIRQSEFLFVHDLYNIPLKAEMVVLSACETALGELQEGEGIISLARAFAYAGAQSIITTLWQVSDQRSSELIQEFYHFLGQNLTKDAALWQAKKAFIDADFNAHPYNWAGFIPIGNMTAVQMKKRTTIPYLYLGIAFLVVMIVVGIFKYKR